MAEPVAGGFNLLSWVIGVLTTAVFGLAALVRRLDVGEINRRLEALEAMERRLDAIERRLERLDKGGAA